MPYTETSYLQLYLNSKVQYQFITLLYLIKFFLYFFKLSILMLFYIIVQLLFYNFNGWKWIWFLHVILYFFQSFIQAEELISAQFPVAGAATDLVRLLIDEDCSFLVSLNPISEVKEVGHRLAIYLSMLYPYNLTAVVWFIRFFAN